jgi:hypothetical protein
VRVAWLVIVAGCGFNPAAVGGSVTIDAPAADDAPDAPHVFHDAPPDAQNAVGWVQGTSSTGTTGTSTSLAFAQAQQAGDLDVVVVSWGATSTHVASVTDTFGETFTRIGVAYNTGTRSQAFYYAPSIVAGANTIAVAFDASADQPELRIAEYAGVVTAAPVEHYTEVSDTGQSMTATLLATANPHDLLVAADTVDSTTDQTDATYTLRLTEQGDVLVDRIVTSAGQYSVSAHQTSSVGFVIHVVAFKLAN